MIIDCISEATIVTHGAALPVDLHLARLTDFSGIPARTIAIDQGDQLVELLKENTLCVMMSARSLAAILAKDAARRDAVTSVLRGIPFLFIYGITPSAPETQAVACLTDGLISSVTAFDRHDHLYHVNTASPQITHEFSGLSFGPSNKDIDFGLVVDRRDDRFLDLVCIDKLPTFACLKTQHSSMFLLACGEIADIDAPSDGVLPASEYFSRVAPLLMFFKHVFGDQTWHNPKRKANLLIDDPLLRRSYGFLDFSQLLKAMDTSDFTSTIGFIPWNYKRTHPAIARLIKERSDKFDLCVHGCDHTKGEFANTNVADLDARVHLATWRMNLHQRHTGIPYAKVFVFPQGKFSSISLGLLKGHNYLAAVNTSPIADDLNGSKRLTLRELLEPAVCKYSSFPLFVRRNPTEIADLAFDLFLGKPAIIGEHHSYFRDGYDKVRDFTAKVSVLSDKLQWTGMDELIKTTYLLRMVSADTVECRIFGNRQLIRNAASQARRFLILKAEDGELPIQSVAANGQEHPYDLRDGYLKLSVDIPGNSECEVAIDYHMPGTWARRMQTRPVGEHIKVYLRRVLSEFRDNHLCKHDKLLALAYRFTNRVGMSDYEPGS